jgi:glycosyltransferase involved in cell wall biosynthesis
VAPDIVHYHGTRAAFFGACARPTLGTWPASVYTAHGLAYRQQVSRARRALLLAAEAFACRRSDRVISVSAADLRDLVRRRFVAERRGHVVPNAVDTERFRPRDAGAARQRLGLSTTDFVVGTVSRLVPQKSVADLVDAVGRVPAARLVIVGDGPLRAELEQRAAQIAERVVFLGSRDDVPEILPAFDVFALSSRWEGQPIALLEAMAAGLAIVATDTEGSRELLKGTEAGILVGVGDAVEMAAALSRLEGDAASRRRMAQAGREVVRARSYAASAERVEGVYGAVLQPRSEGG